MIDVVGGNLIHVRFFEQFEFGSRLGVDLNDMSSKVEQAGLRHAICVATQSEQSAYDDMISTEQGVEIPGSQNLTCEKRHADCKMCGFERRTPDVPSLDENNLYLDLRILGTCRQLYEEANHLLWATNTFSFDHPKTFNKFMASLNSAQKRKISSLHFNAEFDRISSYGQFTWTSALKLSNVNILKGIHTLHLCLQQRYSRAVAPLVGDVRGVDSCDRVGAIKASLEEDIKPFMRLRALNPENVTVIIGDPRFGPPAPGWTATVKVEVAEQLRKQVLDPQGAALVKVEAEAATAAYKLDMKHAAEERVKWASDRVTENREMVEKASRKADRLESEAEKARVKAEDLFNQDHDDALSNEAKTSADQAKRWRSHVKWLEGEIKHWEKEAKARELKLERAKALVEGRKWKKSDAVIQQEESQGEDDMPKKNTKEGYDPWIESELLYPRFFGGEDDDNGNMFSDSASDEGSF